MREYNVYYIETITREANRIVYVADNQDDGDAVKIAREQGELQLTWNEPIRTVSAVGYRIG